jgi:pilus assembly protein TadC
MSIARSISLKIPNLKEKLRAGGIAKKPDEYVGESLKNALFISGGLSIMSFFLLLKIGISPFLVIVLFIISFSVMFFIMIKRVDAAILRREREIDRDVLFAGRFLLVKLNSGKPLINAIVDASNSYGVAGGFFKEIVEDIEVGTPMEVALMDTYKTTPSKKFKKILFQINNALKIGVDVSAPLEAILDEISQEQLIEIQRYGKKLSSLTMFYMLIAIVVPSLGITLISVVASLISLKIDMQILLVVLFFITIVQVIFISIFKSIRPTLNI